MVLHEKRAETAHRSYRRAKIVGHRVAEALQVLIGSFELRRSSGDTLFELRIQRAQAILARLQRFFRSFPLRDLAPQVQVRFLEDLSAVRDFRQHAVERVDEHADLIVGSSRCPRAEIAIVDHFTRNGSDLAYRPGDALLQLSGNQDSGKETQDRHGPDDAEVIEQASDYPVPGLDIYGSKNVGIGESSFY